MEERELVTAEGGKSEEGQAKRDSRKKNSRKRRAGQTARQNNGADETTPELRRKTHPRAIAHGANCAGTGVGLGLDRATHVFRNLPVSKVRSFQPALAAPEAATAPNPPRPHQMPPMSRLAAGAAAMQEQSHPIRKSNFGALITPPPWESGKSRLWRPRCRCSCHD